MSAGPVAAWFPTRRSLVVLLPNSGAHLRDGDDAAAMRPALGWAHWQALLGLAGGVLAAAQL